MFGEWNVTSTLRSFRTPLGKGTVTPGLEQAARQVCVCVCVHVCVHVSCVCVCVCVCASVNLSDK